MPKKGFFDSVFNMSSFYYSQVFSKEFICIAKEKLVTNNINKNLEI